MAALSENGLEVRRSFPGVLQEELESFSGGAILRRESVPPVVVLNQQRQQAKKFYFYRGAGPAFADEVAESLGNLAILRFRFDYLGYGLDQEIFVGCGGHGHKSSRCAANRGHK